MKHLISKSQREYLKNQLKEEENAYLNLNAFLFNMDNSLQEEISMIDTIWNEVVAKHKFPLRLVILAEAPLSLKKYFYNNTGVFLDGLKNIYNLEKNIELPPRMIENKILLMDMYRLPIPSKFYRADSHNLLFDQKYFEAKMEKIKDIVDPETKFVFRYKALIEKFQDNEDFKKIMTDSQGSLLIDDYGKPIPLYISEKPQRINPIIKDHLLLK